MALNEVTYSYTKFVLHKTGVLSVTGVTKSDYGETHTVLSQFRVRISPVRSKSSLSPSMNLMNKNKQHAMHDVLYIYSCRGIVLN